MGSNNNTYIKPNLKNSKYAQGRWHLSEHKKFLEAIIKYGNDWKEVEKYIGTRTSSQARSHAQKFFIKLKQEQMNSKISSTIDYSNATIKNFHDALQSMDDDKREKIIKELENVVFDSQVGNKRRRRNKSKNNCFSESCTDYGVVSGTDFFDDDDSFYVNDEIEEKLYKQYPQYRETNNSFLANGTQVLRFKTIAENKIGNGLPVTLVVPS